MPCGSWGRFQPSEQDEAGTKNGGMDFHPAHDKFSYAESQLIPVPAVYTAAYIIVTAQVRPKKAAILTSVYFLTPTK